VISQFLEACIERQPDILLNISYLKVAQVTGLLFQENCDSGAVSSVFTGEWLRLSEIVREI